MRSKRASQSGARTELPARRVQLSEPCRLAVLTEAMVRALDGCLAVVHLAQIGAERGGQTYEAVNIGYTERVLEDARHAGVPRVVYFSGLDVTFRGRSVPGAPPLDPVRVRQLGLIVAERQAGSFALGLRSILAE